MSRWRIVRKRRQKNWKYQIIKTCASPFGGLLAQNAEPLNIYKKEGEDLVFYFSSFCLSQGELGEHRLKLLNLAKEGYYISLGKK